MRQDSGRVYLRRLQPDDVEALLDLRVRNRDFLQPFEPLALESHYTAAVMPRNIGSIKVLEKVGFRYDGFSEFYLKINGVWEDHNLYSITRERWNSQLATQLL